MGILLMGTVWGPHTSSPTPSCFLVTTGGSHRCGFRSYRAETVFSDCALVYAILHRGLERLRICVSAGLPEAIPAETEDKRIPYCASGDLSHDEQVCQSTTAGSGGVN